MIHDSWLIKAHNFIEFWYTKRSQPTQSCILQAALKTRKLTKTKYLEDVKKFDQNRFFPDLEKGSRNFLYDSDLSEDDLSEDEVW